MGDDAQLDAEGRISVLQPWRLPIGGGSLRELSGIAVGLLLEQYQCGRRAGRLELQVLIQGLGVGVGPAVQPAEAQPASDEVARPRFRAGFAAEACEPSPAASTLGSFASCGQSSLRSLWACPNSKCHPPFGVSFFSTSTPLSLAWAGPGNESAPEAGALPNFNRSELQAATLVGPTSRALLEFAIGIIRGFMASGISRTRSTCKSPFSRLAPLTLT